VTINSPDFDPELEGYTAIVQDGVCHAVVSDPHGNGDVLTSECGDIEDMDMTETEPRKDYRGEVEMCPDCWPSNLP